MKTYRTCFSCFALLMLAFGLQAIEAKEICHAPVQQEWVKFQLTKPAEALMAAPAATGNWTSTGTASGGQQTANIDGKGGCRVDRVTVNGVPKVEGTDYRVDNAGSSRPSIRFLDPLPANAKVTVTGSTSNRGEHVFKMQLR
ncbi:MAG: hypothetical protein ACK6DS_05250 [Planctomycetota bacterium]|jgi:hypothetical protein